MKSLPRVSVVMSAYNAGAFLAPALESVLAQTLRDFECIVIDDASTDGTREALAAFAARDARVRLFHNETNLGLTCCLNRGLAQARAPWIARMDADDISMPERLERQLAAAEASPGASLINCWHDTIDQCGRKIMGARRGVGFRAELLPWFLLFYNRIGGHGQVMYRAETVRAVGGYDEQFTYAQDRELWIRLLNSGPCVTIPRVLYRWRQNAQSMTSALRRRGRFDEGSIRAGRMEIERTCGLAISHDEAVALRDFWLRYDDGTQDWTAVQRRLLELASVYRPPRPLARQSARLREAIAVGWLGHMLRAFNRRDFSLARAQWRRSREAAGARWPAVLACFLRELAAVRGCADRMA